MFVYPLFFGFPLNSSCIEGFLGEVIIRGLERVCYNGCMAYHVIHVFTGDYEIHEHEQKVREALDQIGEAEIYSIQHAIAQSGGGIGDSQTVSTLIVYREYDASA